jgi:uncharacterized membrane protein YedE/YeeE
MTAVTTDAIARGLAGGALIGLAAALLLYMHGRIAGVSGILGGVLARDGGRPMRIGFLAGLIATGAVIARVAPDAIGGGLRSLAVLAVAGALVGFGTTIANGCTSGHGVCGLSYGSRRSFAAVITFVVTGAITVAIAGAGS